MQEPDAARKQWDKILASVTARSADDDQVSVTSLSVASGRLPVVLVFDEITAFRVFEQMARELPDLDGLDDDQRSHLEHLRQRTSPATLAENAGELPPAGANARECRAHFEQTLPAALQREIDRIIRAAFATGSVSFFSSLQAQSAKDNEPCKLPNAPTLTPADAMARPQLRDVREQIVVDQPKENARTIHPKSRGREKNHPDSASAPRAKKAARAEAAIEAEEDQRAAATFGPGANDAERALMFSPESNARADKAAMHKDLSEKEPDLFSTPATVKQRRLRQSSAKKKI